MGVVLSIANLAITAASVGQGVAIGKFQDDIKAVYKAHTAEINSLAALQKTMNLMGLGGESSILNATSSFVNQNFHMLYKASQTQMVNLENTINILQDKYHNSLKAVASNSLNLGLSIAGLAIATIVFTKKAFPQFWKSTVGKVTGPLESLVKNFFLKIRNSLKRSAGVVEGEDGSLGVDKERPIEPAVKVDDPDQITTRDWWTRMKDIGAKLAEAGMIGFMIYQVVEQGKQIHALQAQLTKDKQYFAAGGKFDQDLAKLDTDMQDIVQFYGNLGYLFKQCVASMNATFVIKAFTNHTGRSADVAAAMHYNFKKLGINTALLAKSLTLTQDYNNIMKNNTGLQDRINRYGPMLNTFLQPYQAPQFEGKHDAKGMVDPMACFDHILKVIQNSIANHGGNMPNEENNIQNIQMVGNACLNFVKTRPPNFDKLPLAQKQAQDTGIWNSCSNYYIQVMLGGNGPLWNSDIQTLTGIIMNYVDSFYYDDPKGETINNFNIKVNKSKEMYKELLLDIKYEGSSFEIPYTPMQGQKTAEQMLTEALQYVLTTVPPATKPIYMTNQILHQAQENGALTANNCTITNNYVKMQSQKTTAKDKEGKEVHGINNVMLQSINFAIHGATFEYSYDVLTNDQYFQQLG